VRTLGNRWNGSKGTTEKLEVNIREYLDIITPLNGKINSNFESK
jgi:hypothetical protein